ncbi:hypothetical protein BH10BAC2_BH10BAC2_35240 [soil metagenome]
MKTKLLLPFCTLLVFVLLQQPLHAQAWKLVGNSGTNPATQFLGTTDNISFILRTNNIERLRILNTGNMGIGITAPLKKLDVNGNINLAKDSSIYIGNERVLTMETGVFPVIGNLFLGASSGISNRAGTHNTAAGYRALFSNPNGSNNTAFGYSALYSNYGSNNTATGSLALYSNFDGYNNSASGSYALYKNTSGYDNTASGYYALRSNTTGFNNMASGSYALYPNTTGSNNTASGYKTLYSNTIGNYNSAYGSFALNKNIDGDLNTASGYQALYSNTTGNNNTANGAYALFSNNGNYNTATGNSSLYSNTGEGNTANGSTALHDNTTGSFSTALGYQALISNTTGNGNTAVGFAANVATGGLTNASAIGYTATVFASNNVRIGNSNVTSIGGQVGWTNFSDGRYKKNIKENVKGLAFINSLRPVTYTVDINSLNAFYDKGRKHDSAYEIAKAGMQLSANVASKIVYNGFIAQEVEAAAKKLNYEFSGVDKPQTEDGLYGLRYSDFVVPLVKAVQELSKMNDEKDAKIEVQGIKIDDLQKQVDELKIMVLSGNSLIQNKNTATLSNSSLDQNVPNPFNHTTTINYTLLQKFTSAKLIITDKIGRILKEVNISGTGKGSLKIDASTLSSGAYQYSLYADGRLIDSKQMILAK